jgi:hypothetical protein
MLAVRTKKTRQALTLSGALSIETSEPTQERCSHQSDHRDAAFSVELDRVSVRSALVARSNRATIRTTLLSPPTSFATVAVVARFWTCYQQNSADPNSGVVAHAVSNSDPNSSVAGEILIQSPVDEEWPGRAPKCPACDLALKGPTLTCRSVELPG